MNDMIGSSFKGAFAGMVGGGVGAGIGGAFGALGGGFTGGATGAMLNGAEGKDILYGGLMGAGLSFAGYSAIWGYNNYGSPHNIDGLGRGQPVSVDEAPMDAVEAPEAGEARGMLLQEAANRNINLSQSEVSANFRMRTTFWTGEQYLKMNAESFTQGSSDRVHASPDAGADFRMHTHTGAPNSASYRPSGLDVQNAWNIPSQRSYIVNMGANQSIYQVSNDYSRASFYQVSTSGGY
jgi:hypothetical protein